MQAVGATMFLRTSTALCSLFILASMTCAEDVIALPADPALPVIELWYVDHGQLRAPEIAIFSSGRVQVRVGDGTLWGELQREQVLSLMRTLLKRDQLASLQTAEIEADIVAESIRTGLSCEIKQGGDTIIRVRTAAAVYRVDGHAVGLLSARFPNVERLQYLYSAQRRLENVRAVVMVGGPSTAERLARLAQLKLQAESGEQILVGQENLSYVHSLTDGTRCCQFLVPAPHGSESAPRIISLFESPGETPRVSVLPDTSSLQ